MPFYLMNLRLAVRVVNKEVCAVDDVARQVDWNLPQKAENLAGYDTHL